MAFQSVWFETRLSEDILQALNADIAKGVEGKALAEAVIATGKPGETAISKEIRDAEIAWLPSAHWIAPFLMYYVDRANRENYRFDLLGIDAESLQYTVYGPGKFYGWHRDDSLQWKQMHPPSTYSEVRPDLLSNSTGEVCRKLSFSLQLSEPEEYEGGQFQLMGYDHKMYEAPRKKGTLIIFESTALHRVRPIKKGTRRSLVGWVIGPRWR